MKKDELILVSVDDHVIEPPDMFEGRLPAKYADRAPRLVPDDGGGDKWVFGEGEARSSGLNAVAGRPPEEYGLEPQRLEEMRRGCYDVHERVKDMNANGVLASLNFPSMARFCGQFFASRVNQDPELTLAVVKAYNDWHVEGWCGEYPDRFIPCAIPPIWDPQLMAEEVRRTAAMGSHAVSFSLNPYALGLPSLHSDHWDPFWAACEDTETVVCVHIGSGTVGIVTSPDAPMSVEISCNANKTFPTAADLVWSPIFQKFRNLKIALSEGGIGWIPYFLEKVDYVYKRHRAWTRPELGGRLPSEIFLEHVVTCFIVDDFGIENLHHMNADMVTWECDYPHSDTTWPESPEAVADSVRRLSDEVIDKITHENAMRVFSFDPYSVRPRENCTVGALRKEAEGHDISVQSYGLREHVAQTIGQYQELREADKGA
ncbi:MULTISPECIES: amidohydrolase family protein [unclassified Parafrankia]|uniref:amidohydrolase family protein n=1 Tax=unclassified Parafrankia TaxID=2994368 RepID=UPI000DA452F4|nr:MULTISPECIES: amidohydrolase family protein [unclassified Parafrankia]TCJ30981.1 amidohydrolase [Parafrankia sp. BMG5.11]CAI7974632.1 Amidohydrolase [Frankia sp. Hr75.2]SQD99846.1 Amidohydrolase 2 [Parafrankia sp. Ea1.12]